MTPASTARNWAGVNNPSQAPRTHRHHLKTTGLTTTSRWTSLHTCARCVSIILLILCSTHPPCRGVCLHLSPCPQRQLRLARLCGARRQRAHPQTVPWLGQLHDLVVSGCFVCQMCTPLVFFVREIVVVGLSTPRLVTRHVSCPRPPHLPSCFPTVFFSPNLFIFSVRRVWHRNPHHR